MGQFNNVTLLLVLYSFDYLDLFYFKFHITLKRISFIYISIDKSLLFRLIGLTLTVSFNSSLSLSLISKIFFSSSKLSKIVYGLFSISLLNTSKVISIFFLLSLVFNISLGLSKLLLGLNDHLFPKEIYSYIVL